MVPASVFSRAGGAGGGVGGVGGGGGGGGGGGIVAASAAAAAAARRASSASSPPTCTPGGASPGTSDSSEGVLKGSRSSPKGSKACANAPSSELCRRSRSPPRLAVSYDEARCCARQGAARVSARRRGRLQGNAAPVCAAAARRSRGATAAARLRWRHYRGGAACAEFKSRGAARGSARTDTQEKRLRLEPCAAAVAEKNAPGCRRPAAIFALARAQAARQPQRRRRPRGTALPRLSLTVATAPRRVRAALPGAPPPPCRSRSAPDGAHGREAARPGKALASLRILHAGTGG